MEKIINLLDKKTPHKIFNDPIYGFIEITDDLVFSLIEHPYFQRLRRISQMGLSYLVYPGAHHTRFHHALGCLYLMEKAISILKKKGVKFTKKEELALKCVILLHDMGHGPFSHALEGILCKDIHHEDLSLAFMKVLNKEFKGELNLAIQIFEKRYSRPFFHQLISGHIDIDRLDYLKRDSFYTGVVEGNIGSERIIGMLNVHDEKLVVEEKAVYSVEKFLMSRRFMYWQVYLHKTGWVAEKMLCNIVQRAKLLIRLGENLNFSGKNFEALMKDEITVTKKISSYLIDFASIDDIDVLANLKIWQNSNDKVLALLCEWLLNRVLFKVQSFEKPISKEQILNVQRQVAEAFGIAVEDAAYLVIADEVEQFAYKKEEEAVKVITKRGALKDLLEVSAHLKMAAMGQNVIKYYLAYPKIEV